MVQLGSLTSMNSHAHHMVVGRRIAQPFQQRPCRQRIRPMPVQAQQQQEAGYRCAGPDSTVPDYTAIDSQPLNRVVMGLFRRKMVAAIGEDSKLQG